jgi:hypothetical protein
LETNEDNAQNIDISYKGAGVKNDNGGAASSNEKELKKQIIRNKYIVFNMERTRIRVQYSVIIFH